MNNLFIGIEIGGTKLQITASRRPPEIDRRHRTLINASQGAQGILAEIKTGLPRLLNRQQPTAIGVGFGGPVHWSHGRIACSHQIRGWKDFPLGPWLEDQWKAPAAIDNDANTACLAEALHGAGKNSDPVFYLTLGSGIGGGLVYQDHIYHGAPPAEAEIGHLQLNHSGLTLEQSCSGWAVNRKLRAAIEKNPRSRLAALIREQPGPESLSLRPALDAQDPDALEILRTAANDLAFALSHVVHLQHPQTIILGGGLSLIGEPLRRATADALPQYLMEIMPPPAIRLAQLGEDAVPAGALLLAKQATLKTKQQQTAE